MICRCCVGIQWHIHTPGVSATLVVFHLLSSPITSYITEGYSNIHQINKRNILKQHPITLIHFCPNPLTSKHSCWACRVYSNLIPQHFNFAAFSYSGNSENDHPYFNFHWQYPIFLLVEVEFRNPHNRKYNAL